MADPIVNFFSSTLVGGYSDSDTSLTLATGSGANLPDPSVDGEFNLVIYNESEIFVTTTFDGGSTDTRQDLASTNPEIVRVTARSGDVITVTRAQEGTTASAKAAENTYRVILASTKKVFDDINTAIQNIDITTIAGAESIKFDTTGDEVLKIPVGTTAQRPTSPEAGYIRYNSEEGLLELHNGTSWKSFDFSSLKAQAFAASAIASGNQATFEEVVVAVEYLIVAGGAGGGNNRAGGGGAGGVRSSVSGDDSGGGAVAESALSLPPSGSYTVTVGAGGAAGYGLGNGGNGGNSIFHNITSIGGGGGGQYTTDANDGGSGGGAGSGDNFNRAPGSGTANQGFDGGDGAITSLGNSGGGGGAGGVGETAPSNSESGDGGIGVVSTIISSSEALSASVGEVSGSDVYFGGGGGGGLDERGSQSAGLGGLGGGGRGSNKGRTGGNPPADDGTPNTGGGGGGGALNPNSPDTGGKAGGSGVVILRYPSEFTISIGAGLTASTSTVGANKVTTFTAGTDTISFS